MLTQSWLHAGDELNRLDDCPKVKLGSEADVSVICSGIVTTSFAIMTTDKIRDSNVSCIVQCDIDFVPYRISIFN